MPTASKLAVDTSASAMDMAEAVFGNGITIEAATFTGAAKASGIFEGGDAAAPALTPSDTGVILSTGKAAAVTNKSGDVNAKSYTSTNNKTAGDTDLDVISGAKTFDAAVFEASFVPEGSTLSMQVVFGSEEYLEYVGSGFNDAVGVWVNGQPAQLAVGTGDITINNINDQTNQNLYIDNPSHAEVANTEMDGFTVKLTLKAPVYSGEINTIKIAIADGGDATYDSNLLIAGDSIQTELIARDDAITVNGTDLALLDVLANDSSAVGGTLTITHINGHPVSVGDSVTLSSGQTITLTPEGHFEVVSDGDEGVNVFSYSVEDADGNIDTAFATVTTEAAVACFVEGTRIDTIAGPIPIEHLETGQLVLTLDNGPQPLRWSGFSVRRARGNCAPIEFRAGVLGQHDTVQLSANHRVLQRSVDQTLLFGHAEMVVKASALVDGLDIRVRECGDEVRYYHLLFDRHEIVFANGLPVESYNPGAESLSGFDPGTREEILTLFPQLTRSRNVRIGPTVRPVLKGFEARILASINPVNTGAGYTATALERGGTFPIPG